MWLISLFLSQLKLICNSIQSCAPAVHHSPESSIVGDGNSHCIFLWGILAQSRKIYFSSPKPSYCHIHLLIPIIYGTLGSSWINLCLTQVLTKAQEIFRLLKDQSIVINKSNQHGHFDHPIWCLLCQHLPSVSGEVEMLSTPGDLGKMMQCISPVALSPLFLWLICC